MLKIIIPLLCLGLVLVPGAMSAEMVTEEEPTTASETQESHSVLAAGLLGLVPGAGQVYNGQYTKALIVAGAAGTVVTLALMYRNRAEARRDEYNLETRPDVIVSLVQDFGAERDRNKLCWNALVGVVAISVLDSYIYGWKKNQALKVSLGQEDMEVGYALSF